MTKEMLETKKDCSEEGEHYYYCWKAIKMTLSGDELVKSTTPLKYPNLDDFRRRGPS